MGRWKYKTPLERIMAHVVKHKKTGHWEWVGKGRSGKFNEYGAIRLGKMMSTHRAVWILIKGYIPKDLLHQCDMKLCCNPKHLREGTHQENLKEAVAVRGGKGWGCCVPSEKSYRRKITIKDDVVILKRALAGETQRVIAADYNVTQATISFTIKRAKARMAR